MAQFKTMFSNFKTKIVSFFAKKQKRNFIIVFLSAVILISASVSIASFCASKYPDYIYIDTEEDLNKIRNNLDGDFVFTKQNIDIKQDWIPIGTKEKPFSGTIVGNGCTISFAKKDFSFVEGDENYFGFFANNNGTIKNLIFYLHDMNLLSNNNNPSVFGCVSAYNAGTISNCSVVQASGEVKLTASNDVYAGGMCGTGAHNFLKSKSAVKFDITTDGNVYGGGISGAFNDVTDVWEISTTAQFTIHKSSTFLCGGIVGVANEKAKTKITNCLSRSTFYCFDANDGLCSGIISKSLSDSFVVKNCNSENNFTNNENTKNSNYVGDGMFEVSNCVSSPNFSNDKSGLYFGSFSYKELSSSSFENCYYTKKYQNSFEKYGEFFELADLTISKLNWDGKIWRKNADGSFSLV